MKKFEQIFRDLKNAISIYEWHGEQSYELSASGSKLIITAPVFGMFSGVMLMDVYEVASKHSLSMVVVDNRIEILCK